jgi:hypothetical protein
MEKNDEVLTKLDGIKWSIEMVEGNRHPVPICPIHHLRLKPSSYKYARSLECRECEHPYPIPRVYEDEKEYVLDKIDSTDYKDMETINLDDEFVPLAEERADLPKESPYWIVSKLVESKTGRRLVIYAGEKGKGDKAQMLIDPDIKRLTFDHRDRHPNDIFVKVEVTFDSGDTSTIAKKA